MADKVFVFGSNTAGIHGAGAARTAHKKFGARWGIGYGLHGNSFAIPTKDSNIKTLDMGSIKAFVEGFIAFARSRSDLTFQVTRIGCGLAGLSDADMAMMFTNAPSNCLFDLAWEPWLGIEHSYWGTF
ncbi:hypothetical protein KMC60_gp12 [Achromobacter phage vB_AxyP_19-32_Axy11]|uniref:Uncharacterized protein n=2 Tax=Pourcelvirus Axy11 TaxID=2843622 RepID=A0A514CVY1_9CAUD|nr:hypothetical protein KMC60_gp12 [Achromobacter phage vB_AxyP_19-32_Axy11]QDH84040.1 hypothetical protein Axy11_012 [Achromobacter phage vB_AxyP_19-32_Axy11]QDH84636.1 hypothetical protein Axy22_011 [Achromobacter phage vB_AxyP_19-32_Axy22]